MCNNTQIIQRTANVKYMKSISLTSTNVKQQIKSFNEQRQMCITLIPFTTVNVYQYENHIINYWKYEIP